jgi:hypothetical protein
MTYCGSLCEIADMGFTIEGLLGAVVAPAPKYCELLAA